MSAYLALPTGLTFSDIREGIPPQAIPTLNAVFQTALETGSDNPVVLRLNDFDMGGAAFLRGAGMSDLAYCGPIENISHIPETYLQLMVGVGGDLLGYPVWFEIPDPTADIPATFPNRTYEELVDPEDPEAGTTTTVHTWETWGASTRPDLLPQEINGTWYRSNKCPYFSEHKYAKGVGMPLPASSWVASGLTFTSELPEPE